MGIHGGAHEIMRFYIFKRVILKDHVRTISNRCSGSDASYRIDGQEKLWATGGHREIVQAQPCEKMHA